MDEEADFQKDLYRGEETKERHPPASLRYMGSGLHAETGCRKVYAGEVFSDKKIPWKRRRRLGMAVAGNTPTANFLTKIGKIAGCRLRRIAREAKGESTDSLVVETHGQINSADCDGMATTVMAAHHSI